MHDETVEFLKRLQRESQPIDNSSIVPHGQRRCPICNELMLLELEEGVQTDVCTAHGIWLDAGELRAIVSRIRSHNQKINSLVVKKARKDGIQLGARVGFWALLLDD